MLRRSAGARRCRLPLAIALALVAPVLLASGPASAQAPESSIAPDIDRSETFEITADRIEYQAQRDLYIADGNVRIVRGDRRLDADWVAFSPTTERGVASGGVMFDDGARELEARFIQFDTETLQGAVYEGELEVDGEGLRVKADEFVRTGEDRYRIYDAMLTTCRCPDDGREPWRLRAARSDVEFGGYGQSLNSTVEILRVPVFWIPWVLYPVKTERQSGLLFPKVGVGGRSTFEVGIPVFWAARRNVNITWTPLWSVRRGLKNNLQLESLHGERGRTNLEFAFARDTSVSDAKDPRVLGRDHFSDDRWSLTVDHDQPIGDRVRIRAAGSFASDNQYALDFDDLPGQDTSRWLEAVLFGTARLGDDHATSLLLGARYADDLQAPNDRDRDRTTLQRWPEASLRSLVAPAPVGLLDFLAPSFDFDYVRFSQRDSPRRDLGGDIFSDRRFADVGLDGVPDSFEVDVFGRTTASADPQADPHLDNFGTPRGSERNGRYDVGEPLDDEGHRVVLHPRIQWPMQLFGAFEMAPEVGYQQTFYFSDRFGFRERGVWTARNDLRTRIRGSVELPGLGLVEHTIEPRVGWALTSRRGGRGSSSESQNPLYVPAPDTYQRRLRNLALDNLTLDPSDRLGSRNRLTFAVANRFARQWKPGGVTTGQLADFVVSADLDLTGQDFGQIVLDGRTWPMRGISTRFWLEVDPGEGRIDDALMELNAQLPWKIWTRLDYRFARRIPRFFEEYFTEEARFSRFEEEVDEIHQVTIATRIPLGERWAIGTHTGYSLDTNNLLSNSASIEYFSKCKCWAMAVDVRQNRNRDINFGVRFTLVGPGETKDRPFAGRSGAAITPGVVDSLQGP